MQPFIKHKTGLVVRAFFGLLHLVWAFLVAIGVAQPLVDFIFRLHFIDPPYHITEFGFGTAVLLIIITSVIGYILGWIIAVIWNRFHITS